MNTRFIKWHKHKDLESIAEQVHKKFECEVPVDIDYIAEMLGVDIFDIPRLKEDFGLFGLIGKVKDKFTIFIQKGDLTLTNYNTNFTVAEELSHYILHEKYFDRVNDFTDAYEFYIKIKSKSEMMMELNAKYLAGALLLPTAHLEAKAKEVYEKNKKILSELLDKDCDEIINQISIFLSDIYCAPQGAIAYRLKSKIVGFKEFLKGK